jgi:hypothetical protein
MLDRQLRGWSRPGPFAVVDTSVYIIGPAKLRELDLAQLLDAHGDAIHVLVPIRVVDERDTLKRSKDSRLRYHAAYSLGVLDRIFTGSIELAVLRDEDFTALRTGGIPRGRVSIEAVLVPPRHVRLPIDDDEIIDRALAAQSLAGRSITLPTYDTGQSMCARATDLRGGQAHPAGVPDGMS